MKILYFFDGESNDAFKDLGLIAKLEISFAFGDEMDTDKEFDSLLGMLFEVLTRFSIFLFLGDVVISSYSLLSDFFKLDGLLNI